MTLKGPRKPLSGYLKQISAITGRLIVLDKP